MKSVGKFIQHFISLIRDINGFPDEIKYWITLVDVEENRGILNKKDGRTSIPSND